MLPELPICKSLKLCASLLLEEKSCFFKDPEKFKRCILPVIQLKHFFFQWQQTCYLQSYSSSNMVYFAGWQAARGHHLQCLES